MTDVEYYKEQVKDYQKKIAEEEEKEALNVMAKRVRSIYDAFVGAGFTEQEALWFVSVMFQKALDDMAK